MNRLNPKDFDVTAEQFNEFFEVLTSFMGHLLTDKETTAIAPQLHVLFTDKTAERSIDVYMLDVDFNDSEIKRAIMADLGKKLAEQKQVALAIGLMSEAWLSRQVDRMPSESADRQECVIVTAVTADGKFGRIYSQPIRRFEDGERGRIIAHGDPAVGDELDALLLSHFYRSHIKTWKEYLNI